jgi:hypothetical protein
VLLLPLAEESATNMNKQTKNKSKADAAQGCSATTNEHY